MKFITKKQAHQIFKKYSWWGNYTKKVSLWRHYTIPNLSFDWNSSEEGWDFWDRANNDIYFFKQDYQVINQPMINLIGAEWEASKYKCVIEEAYTELPISNSKTTENFTIKELQLKPINPTNFMEFLRVFGSIQKLHGFKYHKGYDNKAGSLHTHISFKQFIDLEFIKNNFMWIPFSLKMLCLNSNEEDFRDQVISKEGYTRVNIMSKVKNNSKGHAITLNSVYNTAEVRINENMIPLWVYFIPFFIQNKKCYHELYEENLEYIKDNNINKLFKKFYTLFDIKNFTLKYWRDIQKMPHKNYEVFEKVISLYIDSDFDNQTTFEVIWDILQEDKKWQKEYKPFFDTHFE